MQGASGITLRVAEAGSDAALIARLADIIWRKHYTPIIGADQVDYMLATFQSEGAITRDIRNGRDYRVIEDGSNQPLGYLAYDVGRSFLFLSKFYILPGAQRSGAGTRAMELLASHHPTLEIHLTVNKHNHAAIAFYEKTGFRNTGPVVTEIGHGFVMDDWKMEKSPVSQT